MRFLTRVFLYVATALPLVLIVPDAVAQDSSRSTPMLAAGTRVRVTRQGERRRSGTVVGLPPDTLLVHWDNANEATAVPRARMTKLELSRGTYRQFVKSTAIGVGVGTGVGAAAGMAAPAEDQGYAIPGGAILGGLAGGLVGLIVGAQIRERWQELPFAPARARVGLVLSCTGEPRAGLAGAISF